MDKILEGAFRINGGDRFEGLSKSSTGIDCVRLLAEYIGYAFFGAVIVVAETPEAMARKSILM